MKTGILLLNLGTPDSPATSDVRKYLREFLMDPEVIDINPISRWMLINLIIAPTRAPKSAKLYEKIWSEKGSPLLYNGLELKKKLQAEMGTDYVVAFGMRYQKPSMAVALSELKKAGVEKIIALPLYPQYASSTTTSTIAKIEEVVKKAGITIPVQIIKRFHHQPEYIKAAAATAASFTLSEYDHVVFSFHGIPERQITKADAKLGNGKCNFGSCCDTIHEGNQFCYRANCIQTARSVANELSIPKEKYTISFQSRLGRTPWLQPFSDQVIELRAKSGDKKLLVFSLSFVADCLETIYEIGTEYDELFREHGGEKVQLVPSLNSNPDWVKAVKEIIQKGGR
jgi:protoporphyrin/coproporphyrin ferrochelatase